MPSAPGGRKFLSCQHGSVPDMPATLSDRHDISIRHGCHGGHAFVSDWHSATHDDLAGQQLAVGMDHNESAGAATLLMQKHRHPSPPPAAGIQR